MIRRLVAAALFASTLGAQRPADATMPLPEHPRPDFERAEWQNLNGRWEFAFDAQDRGTAAGWTRDTLPGSRQITVPFSWGSALSGVPDSANIGWYTREVTIPAAWAGKRVFVVFGASDWTTTVWSDGVKLGEHRGGYTPFSLELTGAARTAGVKRLTVRVDDSPHPFKLEGKQGYGQARGMWQTVYLEARGADPVEAVHYTPRADLAGVGVDVRLREPAPRDLQLSLAFTNRAGQAPVVQRVKKGTTQLHVDVPMPGAHRWSLDDPFLHTVTVSVTGDGMAEDKLQTYFGMRTVSVVNLPGTDHPYVALNGVPVYLQIALDQAYHPDGFYTFPTDSVLRNEILLARQIGLNALREHIKIESPRKLYWADRLGVLIMADVPNWWGQPDSLAFAEHEFAMRGMFDRDYNHPSVFSYVLFNETWGLRTKVTANDERYLPETQKKVASVYRLAKTLDATRLIEDNSICCGAGHTETDLNTWHEYLPGWRWAGHDKVISDSTFPGSPFHFEKGWVQGRQPMLNSEFGNVWGYTGSTGDVDWSWDYRRAVDAFRRHPKIAGWLYTEHHDVINEWNGYWRFDRTWKETGFGDIVPGMTLRDLHSPMYIAVGDSLLAHDVAAGASVEVPLYASFLTPSTTFGDSLTVRGELSGWNTFGEKRTYGSYAMRIAYRPWMSGVLPPMRVTMPGEPGVFVLAVRLEDGAGTVLHRNFTTYVVGGAAPASGVLADGSRVRAARVNATAPASSQWSLKSWAVLGAKQNGAGAGFIEYRIAWPAGLTVGEVASATFLVEASAKRMNGKDRDTTTNGDGDYMRGGGLQDRSANRNSYPQTSAHKYPSAVTVRVNGTVAAQRDLSDDPADSRGILSWHAQPFDRTLSEAGSYGELLRVPLSAAQIADAAATGAFTIRMDVGDALPGGLAIYGAKFGRYPIDPTVLFVLRK